MVASKLKRYLDIFLLVCGSICFVMLVLAVGYQVFTRYVLNNPSTITEEMARFGQIYLGLIAATYCWGARKHLAITLLLSKLNHRVFTIVQIIIEILISSFILIGLIVGGWNLMVSNQVQNSPALGIPMSTLYIIFPVSGISMMLYSIFNALIHFGKNRRPSR